MAEVIPRVSQLEEFAARRDGWREDRRPKEDRRDSAYLLRGPRRLRGGKSVEDVGGTVWLREKSICGAKMDRHARGSVWRVASAIALLRNVRTRHLSRSALLLPSCLSSVPSVVVVVVVFVIVIQLSYEERRLLSNTRGVEKHDK